MIRVVHPGSGCRLSTHPVSGGQKCTGSRIRNTNPTQSLKRVGKFSDADTDPGPIAFLTPGSGIQDE
jgi:hypothetical protein